MDKRYKGPNNFQHNEDGTTTIFIESRVFGKHSVVIDTNDFDKVSQHRWYIRNCSGNKAMGDLLYAATSVPHPDGGWWSKPNGNRARRQEKLYLHRFLIETPKGLATDHINGNTMDNRKSNLRTCTAGENIRYYWELKVAEREEKRKGEGK